MALELEASSPELYLAAYGHALKMKGAAPATFARYAVFLRQFIEWLGERAPSDVTAAQIADEYMVGWWNTYEGRYGKAPATNTVRNHHTALSSFFNFLEARDHVATNPMRKLADERPKGEKKHNDFLSVAEDGLVLDGVGTPEERIIVSLLRFTGMRAEEAYSVTWDDLDIAGDALCPYGRLFVSKSKTAAGIRTIPILPELKLELRRWAKYQEARGLLEGHLPVLCTKNRRPMTHDFLLRLVKRVAHRAGVRPRSCTCGTTNDYEHDASCPRTKNGRNVSDVTPHTLRRTLATSLRRQGVSIDVVSKILGHSSTKVTEQFYVELENDTVASEFLQGAVAPTPSEPPLSMKWAA